MTGWEWNSVHARWEEGFGQLLRYVERHGDANVPLKYTSDGYQLGNWVNMQRTRRVKGTLDSDREHRLEQVSGWTWDPRADKWEEGFARLLEYVGRHGNALVPTPYVVNGYPLGSWVGTQRNLYRKGTLDAERAHRLQNVTGWTWEPLAARWEESFSRLLRYVERHGDANVPQSYAVDGDQLGAWVSRQRGSYIKGILDPDRESRLLDLPGWTWKASST